MTVKLHFIGKFAYETVLRIEFDYIRDITGGIALYNYHNPMPLAKIEQTTDIGHHPYVVTLFNPRECVDVKNVREIDKYEIEGVVIRDL